MSSFLNRKSVHKHVSIPPSSTKLHTSVGPRRLARSLLLSLSRKTGISSDAASEIRENTSEPSSSDYNNPARAGEASEDQTQAREPVERPVGLSGASEGDFKTLSTSSEAGLTGNDVRELISSQSEGEIQTAQLPLRQGQNATNKETASPQHTAPYKYLLVDDNDINVKILASFMKKLGHGYDTAANGLEALQMYTANPGLYPFVLMGKSSWPGYWAVHLLTTYRNADISMPLMDGLESTRKIRRLERAEKIKPATIIALTGLGSATIQREAIASGMDIFLTKPVNLKALRQTLGGYAENS